MTRKDIIRVISEELGLTRLQTGQIVHNVFDAIVNTLAKNGRVELRNFGVFEVRWRKARQAAIPGVEAILHGCLPTANGERRSAPSFMETEERWEA